MRVRWAGAVLLVVEVALVLSGRLDLGAAAAVFLVVEGALAVLAGAQVLVAVRRYREGRVAGSGAEDAVVAAVRQVLPGPVALLVAHEVRMLSSIGLLLRGRRSGVPEGAVALPYDRALRPTAWLLLGVSVVELVVTELVLPWRTVRLVLLLLGAYGLVFVLAMVAGWIVRPHVLTPEVLRLRSGAWADVRVPVDRITGVTTGTRSAPTSLVAVEGEQLVMGISGATDVEVQLAGPVVLDLGRRTATVRSVRFALDDPAGARRALRAVAGTGGS